jgi:hypothetical protein
MVRQRKVHKLLTRERILGLDLVMGVKRVAGQTSVETTAPEASAAVDATVHLSGDPSGDRASEAEQLTGLPLFGPSDGDGDGDRDGDRESDGDETGDGTGERDRTSDDDVARDESEAP